MNSIDYDNEKTNNGDNFKSFVRKQSLNFLGWIGVVCAIVGPLLFAVAYTKQTSSLDNLRYGMDIAYTDYTLVSIGLGYLSFSGLILIIIGRDFHYTQQDSD